MPNETINKIKKQPTEWEKTLANHISDKGLVSRIYKDLQLNNNNNKIFKWAKNSTQTRKRNKKYPDWKRQNCLYMQMT